MKMLINTIKWDALDHWRYSIRWTLLGTLIIFLLAYILLFFTADLSFYIGGTNITFRPEFLMSGLIFVGGYLMYLYPIISTVYDVTSSRRVSERLVNRPYAMVFAVKLLFNVIIFLIGYVISSFAPGSDILGFLAYFGLADISIPATQSPIFRAALFVPTSIAFYVVVYQTILAKGISKIFSVEGIISLLLAFLLVFNGVLNMPDTSEIALFVAAFIMITFLYERKFEI